MIFKRLINKILMGQNSSSEMTVFYEKINGVRREGNHVHSDGILKKRYAATVSSFSLKKSLEDTAVKDNLYFLETYLGNVIKPGIKIRLLDVGCGTGSYAKIFRTRKGWLSNIDYFGTEIDKDLVDICYRMDKTGTYTISSADEIKYPSNKFEVVFSSSTLHYTLDKWKDSLKEMARVSNKYLVLTRTPVTKYNNSFYVIQTVNSVNGRERHFFIVINRKELENYFEKIGLTIVQRDYTSEEYKIDGVNEKIILVQYLLKKSKQFVFGDL